MIYHVEIVLLVLLNLTTNGFSFVGWAGLIIQNIHYLIPVIPKNLAGNPASF
jgi:hypothetical protein